MAVAGEIIKKINWYKLTIAVLICEGVGIVGSVFTAQSVTSWYQTLNKPIFTPPNWIFAPVWTTLYFLMGIAAYLVWKHSWKNRSVRIALFYFGIQLLLNSLWSFFFFGLKSPFLGLIDIGLLILFLVITIIKFYSISKTAGYLLLPYLAWVLYASALNLSIVFLN